LLLQPLLRITLQVGEELNHLIFELEKTLILPLNLGITVSGC
jgi:hypothetical protein